METKSRFYSMQVKHVPAREKNGNLKNGQEYKILNNKFGRETISCILNWKNGFLSNDDDIPAVQMDDGHIEYWTDGYLDNSEYDSEGNLLPAVIADYGTVEEYWQNGERIKID